MKHSIDSLLLTIGSLRLSQLLVRLPVLCILGAIALVFILSFQASKYTKHTLIPGLPIVGQKVWFEPLLLTRYRYVFGGWKITREALNKVSLRNLIFLHLSKEICSISTRHSLLYDQTRM